MDNKPAIIEAESSQTQLAVRSPDQLMALAIEKGASPETMKQLLDLHKEMKAMAAKEAFDRALAAFQSECPVIVKTRSGPKNAYRYAPMDQIVVQTSELMQRHGFSFSFDSKVEQGWLTAICTVTHSAGHSKPSEFKCPVDAKNPMMSDPQRYGAAMTFAKRYALCSGFGIVTADEDTDSGERGQQAGFGPQKRRNQESAPDSREAASDATAGQPEPPAGSPEGKALAAARFAPWKFANSSFAGNYAEFEAWLMDEGIISDTEDINTMGLERATALLAEIKAHGRFKK